MQDNLRGQKDFAELNDIEQEQDAENEIPAHEPKVRGEPQGRAGSNDPLFGLVIAGAIAIGLSPIIDTDADLRYTLVWGMIALFGVMAWLFGTMDRIEDEDPINLVWGIVFGLILSIPILAFIGGTLTEVAEYLFPQMRIGTMLTYIVFVMPLAETLFFRGLLQSSRSFWLTATLCTMWQFVFFFPLIDRGPLPLIMITVLLMANILYGYVRDRNGLAAAWVSQITVNLILLFIPFAGI